MSFLPLWIVSPQIMLQQEGFEGPPPRCIPTTQSASSSKGLFVGPHHLPKFWGKIPKATTKVTLRSHQLILHVIIASYFLTFIKSLVLSICRMGGSLSWGGLCPGCPLSRVSSVQGISVQGSSVQGVSVQGCHCPGGLHLDVCENITLPKTSFEGGNDCF